MFVKTISNLVYYHSFLLEGYFTYSLLFHVSLHDDVGACAGDNTCATQVGRVGCGEVAHVPQPAALLVRGRSEQGNVTIVVYLEKNHLTLLFKVLKLRNISISLETLMHRVIQML